MDYRDESLLKGLESGESMSQEQLLELLDILVTRPLGPDTFHGTPRRELRANDPRIIAADRRRWAAERRGLELVQKTFWYQENRDPVGVGEIGFRAWVDLRLEDIRLADAEQTSLQTA